MKPCWTQDGNKIYQGDALKVLKDMSEESVHCVCTSPPYWGLRDYGLPPMIWDDPGDCQHVWGGLGIKRSGRDWDPTCGKSTIGRNEKTSSGQFCQHCNAWRGSYGSEPTPELYIKHTVEIFREVRRVLRKDGTLWLNLGDSYVGGGRAGKGEYKNKHKNMGKHQHMSTYTDPSPIPEGLKRKDLCMIPARVALALQADSWFLRSTMPWVKRSAMPESCSDRPASALEYVFLLTKSRKYYFNMNAIKKESTHQAGTASNFARKTKDHIIPGQNNQQHRINRKKTNDNGSRNFRNTDLFFESLEPPFGAIFVDDEIVGLDINPKGFAAAHFATFPPRLPEIAILAGSSERGCCAECGSPWEGIVEKDYSEPKATNSRTPPGQKRHSVFSKERRDGPIRSKTLGWKPGCKCYGTDPLPECPKKGKDESDEDYYERIEPVRIDREVLLALWKPLPTIPAIVLDPFGGAMTTAVVAYKYDRKFTMIELSESYIKDIGIPRIDQETKQLKLFNRM